MKKVRSTQTEVRNLIAMGYFPHETEIIETPKNQEEVERTIYTKDEYPVYKTVKDGIYWVFDGDNFQALTREDGGYGITEIGSAVVSNLIVSSEHFTVINEGAPEASSESTEETAFDFEALLTSLNQEQRKVTADWKYIVGSDNPLDIAEARRLYTRSVDLASDIKFWERKQK